MAYVLVFDPAGTSLEEMVEAFGARWTVEQCFEEAKGEVGLYEYEVRSWHGWYRHVTLSMFAMVFLTALRVASEETALKKSLICWTQFQNQRHSAPITSMCFLISR
jgi:SRSO17 transposase